ncbi:LD-carboxypeptidase [Kribbella qitaiheensis]|uniref:LD-carboxypeptidase n=1 Tax=Kribbella qitaiheensis TaxID=1544730 RepID=A0A7G6WY06_9ACTN|nr:LD-carboxypeptidase [Kribbella qitaiheensis]QNE18871.1 LD-carboxypeptidase [Kribbella qitaiheensis]
MIQEGILPARLTAGDHVVIVSPSSTIADRLEQAESARQNIESIFGLRLVYAANARGQHFYSSGTAQQRSDDIMSAFSDPDVRAVLFSTGGATAIDLVDRLDYATIAANPKIVAGLSDSSTLLNAVTARTGVVTYHGFEMFDYADGDLPYASQSMREILFDRWSGSYAPNQNWRDLHGDATTYREWRTIKEGKAQGFAIGGNSEAFMQLAGTSYAPNVSDAILFLETYRLQKRHIQALLVQLKLRGIFESIRGLVVGYCLGSDEPGGGNDRDIAEIAREVSDGYDFPIMQIGEIGHQVENLILPLGIEIELNATLKTLRLPNPAVR